MSIKLTMTAALLSAVAFAATASAQTASNSSTKGDMARCQQLYSQRAHYHANGSEATAQDVQAEMALQDCRAGRYDTGITALEGMLRAKGIPVPQPPQAAESR
jgi:hypothetical protein